MARFVLCFMACLTALMPTVGQAQTTVKYVHTDALGSVVAMTDATGAIIETAREYEPYGQQLVPAIHDGPGYTGHVQDAATGLTYMQQRYYDPAIGRFLSVDPITAYSNGDSRYFNRYWYGAGNPYKFTDPDGRGFDTAIDAGFIIYDTGRFLGAAAAWAHGKLSGNEALASAGREGMAQTGRDLGASAASAAVPGLLAPMARGLATEARVLDEIGEAKNTEKFSTSHGDTIPDFQNAKQVGEIKDTKRAADTRQMKAQREVAQRSGREHVVSVNQNTQVTKPLEQNSTVIRRKDPEP